LLKYDYSNKVALVTGSSRGIGYATAKMLLDSGAHVMINGVDEGRLEAASKSLSKYGESVVAHRADIRSRREVERMFKTLIDHWGRIDILVNNAADRPIAS
jgi:NAD(P)-dependent dehydrogenase (short-subunit alcohol dehydrogenase family)